MIRLLGCRAGRRGFMTDWGCSIRRIENAVTVCERCGGAVKIIACIQNPTVTAKIPEYVESSPQLKLPSARAPPAGSGLLVLVHPGTLWSIQPSSRNCCITGVRDWEFRASIPNPGAGILRMIFGEPLGECSVPDLLRRPEVPIPTAPERELPLPNPMGQLDAG
jgi:hypothetical protein